MSECAAPRQLMWQPVWLGQCTFSTLQHEQTLKLPHLKAVMAAPWCCASSSCCCRRSRHSGGMRTRAASPGGSCTGLRQVLHWLGSAA